MGLTHRVRGGGPGRPYMPIQGVSEEKGLQLQERRTWPFLYFRKSVASA